MAIGLCLAVLLGCFLVTGCCTPRKYSMPVVRIVTDPSPGGAGGMAYASPFTGEPFSQNFSGGSASGATDGTRLLGSDITFSPDASRHMPRRRLTRKIKETDSLLGDLDSVDIH
jgi:hypothetical protein